MTKCQWCGGDPAKPGHNHSVRHRFWLFWAQVRYML